MSRRIWAAVGAALLAVGVAVAWLLSGSSSTGAPAPLPTRGHHSQPMECDMLKLSGSKESCKDILKGEKENARQCRLPVAERKGPWIC